MAILPQSAFQFAGATYTAVSPVLDAESSINLYPETAPTSAKAPIALIGTPGLTLFVTLPTSPVRGLFAGNGRLFAAAGSHFYELSPTTGATITDFGAMGASSGNGPVKIVSNGTQLLVMDSSIGQIFNANTPGPSMDLVFAGFDLEYLDDFFFALKSGVDNVIQNSAAGNGGSWPALNAIVRTTTADKVNALAVVNSNLWIMGQKTMTPYYNIGASGWPLALIQGGTIQQGLFGGSGSVAAFSAVKIDNTLMWVGADDRGFCVVYKASGLTPVRVSNYGVENLIAEYCSTASGGTTITAYAYQEDGHLFYVTNWPLAYAGKGATLVYDCTTNMWHQRAYLNGSTLERARPDCFASMFLGASSKPTNFVGDYANGNIYIQSLSATSDNGTNIQRQRTAPVISDDNGWLAHGSLQIDADIGTANMVLTYSNDGARSFTGGPYTIPKVGTSAGSGVNTFTQNQLGRSRQRVYRVTITDGSNPIRLIGAMCDVYK